MISCVILTHNNEKNIEPLLEMMHWCDECIVVDDDSTDKTRDIAKRAGAIVVKHALQNDFAAQRNIGLAIAKGPARNASQSDAGGDWILFVDSDELVSPLLAQEIQAIVKDANSEAQGYYMKRIDTMWGRELRHGETRDVRLLRLARSGAGKWKREVHEVWDVTGGTKTCMHPLSHSPHPDVPTFLAQINRYTTINAAVFYAAGIRANVGTIVMYPVAKFFQNYIIKLGFLDGTVGFVHAMMMAFHSFLTRAKLWQINEDKEK
ncbi:MAG: glycosyltransferase family 2 protein [Microgenomates group bacterium]